MLPYDFPPIARQKIGEIHYVTQKPAVRNSPGVKHLQNPPKCVYLCSDFWF